MAEPVEETLAGCWKTVAVLLVLLCGFVAFASYHFLSATESLKVSGASGDIGAFNSVLEKYRNDVSDSTYPADLRQLLDDNSAGWDGPYMATITKDPWGNEYSYQSDGHDYTLMSVHEDFLHRTRTETVRYILSEGVVSRIP